ncbi:growth factor receptor domain-containing protein [Pholiota conissans]|uniref:Growth factor receptor domain-containing protein n=1 Tax=Pholiota conissans TaxID=109636 RepID=A0A9P5ZE82_9AGAR|nr:growth factor receptor domain-containing protein [Pholiota conissans]
MLRRFSALSALLFPISIFAQSTPTILCISGQCLQGYSNTTIGTIITGTSNSVHLLPGVYDASTNPQLLHDSLTSSSASLSPSAGFNSSLSLPLTVALQPGFSTYSDRLYSGQASFSALPSTPLINSTKSLTASSLALASDVWIALNIGSTNRVIVWDAVPDVAQLPTQGALSLVDIQSAACSPTCSSGGVCSAAGVCQCQPGFSGASCETCAPGFFGPTCQACPANCTTCDEGITGTGRCLKPTPPTNAPANCNCKNGVCGANGTCSCTPGFTTGNDGTQCSKCLPGFFQTSSGDCKVCNIGCAQCSDVTGQCTACRTGQGIDSVDNTKCNVIATLTQTGTVCPQGTFSNGTACQSCSSACATCTGPTANDCGLCALGTFFNNGQCVSASNQGVCSGSDLIADNNKRECDSCGASCTTCQIQNFGTTSTVDQKKCTGCLPGFFLSNGTCVASCPAGTTVSTQDNLTCISCDSSCATCSGSPTFCLTCANNQLASKGQCVSTCPSSTFSSSGACLSCHADCASCSGGSFNQCTSCPASRPVLLNGRCVPTCARNQFLDPSSGTCQSCDSSCSSCSGAGPSNCLACASSSQKLSQGTCVAANCQADTSIVAGLGVCLSDLVSTSSSSTDAQPLPPVSGIDTNTKVSRRLEWWEILLMALGCAFIFLAVIWCFRRRQRKKRANAKMVMYGPDHGRGWRWKLAQWARKLFGRTPAQPASPVGYLPSGGGHFTPMPVHEPVIMHRGVVLGGWRRKLIRWGEKLFGHAPSQPTYAPHIVHLGPIHHSAEDVKPYKAPAPTPAARDVDMVKLIESYNRGPGKQGHQQAGGRYALVRNGARGAVDDAEQRSLSDASSHMSAPSVYSQLTGVPRRVQDPRLPVRRDLDSRFSVSTFGVAVDERERASPSKGNAKRAVPIPF